MANESISETRVILGDPAPWFSAATVSGGAFHLHMSGGRWVVLSFLGSPADPRASVELDHLLRDAELFNDDHMVFGCVLTEQPTDAASLAAISSNALYFIADYDGAISKSFGALGSPRTIVLDPMLRVIADVAWDNPQGHAESIHKLLRSLPKVDDSAGVPMMPPVLIVPRVFGFDLSDFLIDFYEQQGGEESGFQFDIAGKTATLADGRLKRRKDVPVGAPEVRELIRSHIVRRLVPEIERYFQFKVTRMDRYIVACYDAKDGGHFHRHRDNVNVGAQHRRFALSLALNGEYEGGNLMFPEFGRKSYRPPIGGAMVFSCGALHQVTPVTKGRRYVFLAFMYAEEDAKKREANNSRLHITEQQYTGELDRLFPEEA